MARRDKVGAINTHRLIRVKRLLFSCLEPVVSTSARLYLFAHDPLLFPHKANGRIWPSQPFV
jgi:hypothetical protein